jgi:hypothetical protein
VTITPGLIGKPAAGPAPDYELTFESYANTAALIADNGAGKTFTAEDVNSGQIFLDTVNAAPGTGLTKSMRFDQADQTGVGGSGTSGRCGGYTIERCVNLPSTWKELWVEIWEKFSSGWTCVAPAGWGCTSGNAYKHFFGRISPGPRFDLGIIPPDWIWDYPPGGIDLQTAFSAGFDPGDGNWHTNRIHWKASTTTSSADGVVQGWQDTVQVIDATGLNMQDNGGQTVQGVYGFAIGIDQNNGPPQNQSVWWGRIRAWQTNPGW